MTQQILSKYLCVDIVSSFLLTHIIAVVAYKDCTVHTVHFRKNIDKISVILFHTNFCIYFNRTFLPPMLLYKRQTLLKWNDQFHFVSNRYSHVWQLQLYTLFSILDIIVSLYFPDSLISSMSAILGSSGTINNFQSLHTFQNNFLIFLM